jgi:hypothetical protein
VKLFLHRVLKWSMMILTIFSNDPNGTKWVEEAAQRDLDKWKKQDEEKRKKAELKAERAIAQAAAPAAPPKDAAPKDNAAE